MPSFVAFEHILMLVSLATPQSYFYTILVLIRHRDSLKFSQIYQDLLSRLKFASFTCFLFSELPGLSLNYVSKHLHQIASL